MSEHAMPGREATRRRLTDKQADTIDRLTAAVVEVLSLEGYSGTKMRWVAAAAGVSTATAYTYFSSKEHLISVVYWRHLIASPPPDLEDADRGTRVVAVLRQIVMLLADEPALVGAVSSALLRNDPDVKHLRVCVGSEIRRRLSDALGADDRESLDVLELLYFGALLHAGMGYTSNVEAAQLLEVSAQRLLG